MLPSEPVDCFSRYDTNLEKVMEKLCIHNLLADNGSDLLCKHTHGYARHLVHTEETDGVFKKSRVKCDPNASTRLHVKRTSNMKLASTKNEMIRL